MKDRTLLDNFWFKLGYVACVVFFILGAALPGFPYPRLLSLTVSLLCFVGLIGILRLRRANRQS